LTCCGKSVYFRSEIITSHTKPDRIKEIFTSKLARSIPRTRRRGKRPKSVAIVQQLPERKPGVPCVWVGLRGVQLQVRNWMRQYCEPAVKEANVLNLCWYHCRHSSASRIRRAEVSLDTLQEVAVEIIGVSSTQVEDILTLLHEFGLNITRQEKQILAVAAA
jgi:hypothetical protein